MTPMNISSEHTSARALRKQEQILDAARRLFLAEGYSRTSTNAIARAAGVSKETLYAYYLNKEALFSAVLQHTVGVLGEGYFKEIQDTMLDSREAFQQALTDMAQQIIRNTMQPDYLALVRLVIAESAHLPLLGSLFRSSIPARGQASLIELLDVARERRLIQVADVKVAARMFIGSLLTYIIFDGLMVTDGAPRQPDAATIAMVVTLFCKVLFCETSQSE